MREKKPHHTTTLQRLLHNLWPVREERHLLSLPPLSLCLFVLPLLGPLCQGQCSSLSWHTASHYVAPGEGGGGKGWGRRAQQREGARESAGWVGSHLHVEDMDSHRCPWELDDRGFLQEVGVVNLTAVQGAEVCHHCKPPHQSGAGGEDSHSALLLTYHIGQDIPSLPPSLPPSLHPSLPPSPSLFWPGSRCCPQHTHFVLQNRDPRSSHAGLYAIPVSRNRAGFP